MALLDIEHLDFCVDGRMLLAGLEMRVGAGEIHALLGPNGTGKTTLACLLMGCAGYLPTAGRMRFRGRDLTSLPMHERARHQRQIETLMAHGLTAEEALEVIVTGMLR